MRWQALGALVLGVRDAVNGSSQNGGTKPGRSVDLRKADLRDGGERGIRTPDTRKGIHAFEARAFSHSAISPRPPVSFLFYQGALGFEFPAHLTELSPAQPPHPSQVCGL